MLDRLRTHLPLVRVLASTLLGVRKLRADLPADYSDFLAPHFAAQRDELVLIGEKSRFTWAELDALADRVAGWAIEEGMKRGDVVALSMENRPEYVGIWLGLSRIGVVTALLNTNLTGERLAHCLREASPRAWIVGLELLEESKSALPHLETPPPILAADLLRETSSDPALRRTSTTEGAVDSFDARSRSACGGRDRSQHPGGDGAAVICSSSSTRAARPASPRPRGSAI